MNETPREILDTILGYLGFAFDIQEQERDGHAVLQVYTRDADLLIGRHEQTLEDLQFLVNRLLLAGDPSAPRVIVDVEHHRDIREHGLVQKVQHLAEAVRNGSRPLQTELMNAYDRRIVHHPFKDDPLITTWSPPEEARMKRITLRLRKKS